MNERDFAAPILAQGPREYAFLVLGLAALYAAAMANLNDVRRIALSLPETSSSKDRFAFSVRNRDKDKAFVWVWQERINPKKPRVPNPNVVAVRVAGLLEKDALIASDKKKFFTEPHYDGFPAVLVRLPEINVGELRELITAAWRCRTPGALVDRLGDRPGRARNPRKRSKVKDS